MLCMLYGKDSELKKDPKNLHSTTEKLGSCLFSCFFFFFNIYLFYLFICLFLALAAACGIKFPDQGLNPGPLHWEHRVLATGPPGKSLFSCF